MILYICKEQNKKRMKVIETTNVNSINVTNDGNFSESCSLECVVDVDGKHYHIDLDATVTGYSMTTHSFSYFEPDDCVFEVDDIQFDSIIISVDDSEDIIPMFNTPFKEIDLEDIIMSYCI